MVTIEDNALRFIEIASHYPDLKLEELIAKIPMTPIDINTAIWRAKDMGWIELDEKEGTFKLAEELPTFPVHELNQPIKDRLKYAFKKLAENKDDMEENALNAWFAGWPSDVVAVALKQLVEDCTLFTYTIRTTDKEFGKSDYTFYTLFENQRELWGKKQFPNQKKIKVL